MEWNKHEGIPRPRGGLHRQLNRHGTNCSQAAITLSGLRAEAQHRSAGTAIGGRPSQGGCCSIPNPARREAGIEDGWDGDLRGSDLVCCGSVLPRARPTAAGFSRERKGCDPTFSAATTLTLLSFSSMVADVWYYMPM